MHNCRVVHPKKKLAGGFVSQPVFDRLALTAVWQHLTKSEYIRNLIVKDLDEQPTTDVMLRDIARRYMRARPEGHAWERYVGKVEEVLMYSLPEYMKDSIMTTIRELHDEASRKENI